MSADKLQKIKDELSALTIMEAAELAKILKEEWGVEDVAPMAMAAAPAAGGAAAPAEEKSSFNVVAKGFDNKMQAIKVVKEITGLNLKEAKDLVEKIEGGEQVIKENVSKDDSGAMKEKLEAAGVKVELK
jgi:large subunit ribosomal protein L7/L12